MEAANPVQSDVILPPGPPPANGNGAGTVPHEVVQQVAQAADAEAERKLAMIRQLGRSIEKMEQKRDKQETVVAERKSEFESARDVLNQQNREIDEAKNELVLLSTGKSSERLPFKDPNVAPDGSEVAQDGQKVAPNSEEALQAAFDAMPLAEIGVKPALADKLVADGICTGRDLRDWLNAFPVRKVQGVGPKAVENLGELMAVKMLFLQEQMKVAQRAGDFPTRDEAAVAAADMIDEALPKKGLKGKAAKESAAIRRELDRMEKALAEAKGQLYT